MINKLRRLQLMEDLSAFYQNEDVSSELKKAISDGLRKNDNILLHKSIVKLEPKTEFGKKIYKEIILKLEEDI